MSVSDTACPATLNSGFDFSRSVTPNLRPSTLGLDSETQHSSVTETREVSQRRPDAVKRKTLLVRDSEGDVKLQKLAVLKQLSLTIQRVQTSDVPEDLFGQETAEVNSNRLGPSPERLRKNIMTMIYDAQEAEHDRQAGLFPQTPAGGRYPPQTS